MFRSRFVLCICSVLHFIGFEISSFSEITCIASQAVAYDLYANRRLYNKTQTGPASLSRCSDHLPSFSDNQAAHECSEHSDHDSTLMKVMLGATIHANRAVEINVHSQRQSFVCMPSEDLEIV